MNTTRIRLSLLTVLFLSLTVLLGIKIIFADASNNLVGYAWSSNVGWIKINNCDSSGNCSAQNFGLSVLPTAPGTITGYAWSSNVGWITFDTTGCPSTGVQHCTGGAYADWDHPNSNGSVNIKGWARVCSVYLSGCSGNLKSNTILGSWDGYIALGDPNSASNAAWGVTISPTHALQGYAWGSDVVGWIDFDGVSMNVADPVISDFGTDTACVQPNAIPNLSWATSNATTCTLDKDGGTPQSVATSSQGQGGVLAPDGKYYAKSPFAVSGTGATFTLTCGITKQSLVVPVCTSNTTPPSTPGNPSNPNTPNPTVCPVGQTLDSSGQCTATTCPTGTVLNPTSGACDPKKKPIFKEF